MTAENGLEALELLQAQPLRRGPARRAMPELDGYEVLARHQGRRGCAHVPVIMISALDDIQSVVRCIELGAEDYLPKPFDPVLLRARVNALPDEKAAARPGAGVPGAGRSRRARGARRSRTGRSSPTAWTRVAERGDALGQLARVFQRMAREVAAREQALKAAGPAAAHRDRRGAGGRQVAEITETDYFQDLQRKVGELRRDRDARPLAMAQIRLHPLVPRRHRQVEHDRQPRRAAGAQRAAGRRRRHRHPVAGHPRPLRPRRGRRSTASLNDYLWGKCEIERRRPRRHRQRRERRSAGACS